MINSHSLLMHMIKYGFLVYLRMVLPIPSTNPIFYMYAKMYCKADPTYWLDVCNVRLILRDVIGLVCVILIDLVKVLPHNKIEHTGIVKNCNPSLPAVFLWNFWSISSCLRHFVKSKTAFNLCNVKRKQQARPHYPW